MKWNLLAGLLIGFISNVTLAAAPQLLLLTRYQPEMVIDGWLMSEKLDGVRAYWDGSQLLSRQGNKLFAPTWFTDRLPPFKLDGELWVARGRFQETLSIVSREKPHQGWWNISYNIFEVPEAEGGLRQRLAKLDRYLSEQPLAHVNIIPQNQCRDTDHLMQQLALVEQHGGEGLVLRNPNSHYETGRSLNALKVKRFDDMEGRVIGYRAGKGKYKGLTGALWVELGDNRRFYIGSGLSDAERKDPPALGSTITFRYQGLTNSGLPRFATYMRVRKAD